MYKCVPIQTLITLPKTINIYQKFAFKCRQGCESVAFHMSMPFTCKPTNPESWPQLHPLSDSHSGPLFSYPNHPGARYQTTSDSTYTLELTEVIPASQSQTSLPCLALSCLQKHNKGLCPHSLPPTLGPPMVWYAPFSWDLSIPHCLFNGSLLIC